MIARMLAACAALAMTGSWVSQARDESQAGYILPATGGCGVIGAWKITASDANKVRVEMPISQNPSATVYDVDCSDLSSVAVSITNYDQTGNVVRTIPINIPNSDARARPVLEQICAISRGESARTWGQFHSIAEFRTQAAHIDPAYFEGQPPCLRAVGPPTITSPNH